MGAAMDYNRRRIGSVDCQALIWNGALILVCAGIFALMLLSDAYDAATRCFETDSAAQEACLQKLKAEAARPPAKGPYPLVQTTEQHGH
jgi:hypothetical protein